VDRAVVDSETTVTATSPTQKGNEVSYASLSVPGDKIPVFWAVIVVKNDTIGESTTV